MTEMPERLIKALGYVGGIAIAAMMLLILGEVLSRALLGQSIPGALEIVGMFLSLAVFLSFAPSEQAHQHVSVGLLRARLRPSHRSMLDMLASLVALVVVAVMAWAVGADAYTSFVIREVLPGAEWEVPVYPAKIAAFVGFMAFGLQLLLNVGAFGRRIADPEPGGKGATEMDPGLIGILGIVVLLVLLLTGIHAGLVLCLVGGVGLMILTGPEGGLMIIGSTPFATASTYDLSPLPLFLLMGAFASNGGLGALAFEAVGTLVGRLKGGLAIASTFGSAFFGLACGSSLAAAGVFTKAALPELLSRGYDRRLAIGSIAAAGTFSTMLPPSGLLIVYAIFTGESIGRLFMAGIVPGTLTAVVYAAYIYGRVAADPTLAPQDPKDYDWSERRRALMALWPIVLLVGLVLGGIFAGWFTATEAGGIGAAGALGLAVALRGWRGARVKEALLECVRTNGMIFLIIIGAMVFGRFLSVTQIPMSLSARLTVLSIPGPAILLGVLLMYLVLGMFLDAVAILAITLPIVFPLIVTLGLDPIWFAIAVIKVTEIGLVTPPVGMNVFVCVSAAEGRVSAGEAFRGVAPFVLCDLVVLGAILSFPQMVLWLPDLMFN